MLFYIHPEITDKINSNQHTDVVNFAQNLAQARIRGRHVIYSDSNTINNLSELSEISASARRLYSFLKNKIRYKKDLFENTCVYVKISNAEIISKRNNTKGQTEIEIPITLLNDDEFFRHVKFIVENPDDADLYAGVSRILKKEDPKIGNFGIGYEIINGGGSGTPKTYKEIKEKRNLLCLCIVDSDKNFPSASLGTNVADPIYKDDKAEPSPLTHSEIIPVYSIESMIPPKLLRLAHKHNNTDITDSPWYRHLVELSKTEHWKYLPMKKGLQCTEIQADGEFSKYWLGEKNILENIAQCTHWENRSGCPTPSCMLIEKISQKSARLTATYIKEKSNIEIKTEDMPPSIEKAWLTISTLITSWCCSGSPIVV